MTTRRRPPLLPDAATFQGVIMEQIVALDPDLVLAAGNYFTPPEDIARMRELGYPVVVVYAPDVPSVLADIELIGAAIGAVDEAEVLTTTMADQLATIAAAAAATGELPRTFYQIGSEPEVYAPAPESFVADMLRLAGGTPITTSDPDVFSIPLEELIAADPEVIIVGDAIYGVCPADVAARPGWSSMTAVVNNDIRPVDETPVTRPGPRLAQGLASIARAIHPDVELPGFPAGPAALRGTLTMTAPELARGRVAVQPGYLEALRRRPVLLGLAGLLLLAIAIVAGIALGTVSISAADTIAILAHKLLGWPVAGTWPQTSETIVMELRLPRVLTALIVGTGLAVAGVTFQGLLRNPLADPYVLGTASGAALGAAIGVLIPIQVAVLGLGLVNILAFVGALLAVLLVHRVAGGGGRATLTTLLLTGYAVGSLLAAGLALAMYLSGAQLRQIFFYLLGSLSGADWQSLVVGLPVVVVGSLLIMARARSTERPAARR